MISNGKGIKPRGNSVETLRLFPVNNYKVWLICSNCLWVCACNPEVDIVEAGNTQVVVDTPADLASSGSESYPSANPKPPEQSGPVVCEPFSNNPGHPGAAIDPGIVASLKYLPDSAPRYTDVLSYLLRATPVDVTLFFSELNIPTRSFSLGFMTQEGKVIQNEKGNTLYEYFSLHFETELQLSDQDKSGPYQLALLADDGAVLKVKKAGEWKIHIDDDSVHPTRFAVAKTPLTFSSRNTRFPIRLDYFQGPRYHIALMLLWRPWPKGSGKIGTPVPISGGTGAGIGIPIGFELGSGADPLDGASGNNLFFDYTKNPSVPTSTYAELLSRGWKPLKGDNFLLPEYVRQNPCTGPLRAEIRQVTPEENPTKSRSAEFTFVSNRAEAGFICSLDAAEPSPCSSPMIYKELPLGNHSFKVQAVLGAYKDLVGDSYSWTISEPIATTITSASPVEAVTNLTSISLTFKSNYAEAEFQCNLDGGEFFTCVSPLTLNSLSDGHHIVKIFASAEGQQDAQGAEYSWDIDAEVPRLVTQTFTPGPDSLTISWTTSEPTTSQVSWGPSGTITTTLQEDLQLTTTHQVIITGLSPGAVYSYRISGNDSVRNSFTSSVFRARTSP